MRRVFNISESDRRRILSLHNLITEETKFNVTVKGTIKNTLDEPLAFIKVVIYTTDNKLIKGSLTDDNGGYAIETPLEAGQYTLKIFYGKENIVETLNVTKDEIFIVDKKLDTKVQEIQEVPIKYKLVRVPILDINVSDKKNNKLTGAKVSIFDGEKQIEYSIFKIEGQTFSVDKITKQTTDGVLKNIVIDTKKYPEFLAKKVEGLKCLETKKVTIKIDYEGSIFSSEANLCLSNAYYSTDKETDEVDTTKPLGKSLTDTNTFSYIIPLYYNTTITVTNLRGEPITNTKVVVYKDSSKKETLFTTKTDSDGVLSIKLNRDIGQATNIYVEVSAKKYQPYGMSKEIKLQNENIKVTLQDNDLTLLKVRVFDQETDDMIGPGTVEIYNDVNKNVFVGEVSIDNTGVGTVYLGTDSSGTPRISKEKGDLNLLNEGRLKLYLYSFEQGYDEFFKSYTFSVFNDGSIVTLDVPINYFKEQDDDDNQEDFPLKKRKRFVYGESIKKFKTEDESIQDARKEALKSYVTKNKKYMDRTDLNDAVPSGGEVIYLHKYDDGTYYTVVKFKKRDLKKFIKSFVKKETPVVTETKEIKFTDISLTDALENSKMGDEYMVFAISVNGSSSKKLLTDITTDEKLLSIINTRYTNIKVTNDTNDKNYQIAIDNFKLPGFPCVFMIKQGKAEPYFKNERGSIYLQLVDYFK